MRWLTRAGGPPATPVKQGIGPSPPLALDDRIRTNQVGFQPRQSKHVTIAWGWPGDSPAAAAASTDLRFQLVRLGSEEAVYSGELQDLGRDPDANERVLRGDFSGFSVPGIYQVRLPGRGLSRSFLIAEDALSTPLRLATRWLYLQRSGAAKDDPVTGLRHGADYTQPARPRDASSGRGGKTAKDGAAKSGAAIDVSGGWWDAGDFGRYVPSGASTVMSLLYAYRINPGAFADGTLSIPESGNGVPDLLDELRWELRWLLKMQRPDGAVHHKAATRRYAQSMADADTQPILIYEVTTQATAQLAGALAAASIDLRSIDATFADMLLKAAERAWGFLRQQPQKLPPAGFKNPDDPNGGDYSVKDKDESELRMWAAASLFAATGAAEYDAAFRDLWRKRDTTIAVYGLGWPHGGFFAMQAYLDSKSGDPALKSEIRQVMLSQARTILRVVEETPYRVALRGTTGTFGYDWGSIGTLLNHATYLVLAHRIEPEPQFLDAAAAQLSWVLGANPLGKCFMTGIGHNPIRAPHHRPSFHLGSAVPGAVGEGPNAMNDGGDPLLKRLFTDGVPAAKRYVDDAGSWATNEPTLYYNAAFIAVAARFVPGRSALP